MAKRILMHLGDSKTGSTALQMALRRGASAGTWCYPGAGLNQNSLAHALFRPKAKATLASRFTQIWREIETSDAPIAIISAEHFQRVAPDDLARAIMQFWPGVLDQLRLISYIRPHHSKLCAMYSERVKFGQGPRSLEDYAQQICAGGRLDYAPRLRAWQKSFGCKFTARPYLRSSFLEGDVVRDFLHWARCAAPDLPKSDLVNSSLRSGQISLLQRLPMRAARMGISQPLPSIMHRLLCLKLRRSGIGSQTRPLALLPTPLAQLAYRFASDATEVDAAFFDTACLSQQLCQDLCGIRSGALSERFPLTPDEIARFDHMALDTLTRWADAPDAFQKQAKSQLRAALRPDLSECQGLACEERIGQLL